MFNWFRKKREEVLEFPDNAAAFAHACSVGYPPLIGALIPALVAEEGGGGAEGERTFLISAATAGGAVEFWSCTLKEAQFHPKAGDLVGFRIVTIASDVERSDTCLLSRRGESATGFNPPPGHQVRYPLDGGQYGPA